MFALSILMSFSIRLDASFFLSKHGKNRSYGERKCVSFTLESAFFFQGRKYFSLSITYLIRRVNSCGFCREKVVKRKKRKNKDTTSNNFSQKLALLTIRTNNSVFFSRLINFFHRLNEKVKLSFVLNAGWIFLKMTLLWNRKMLAAIRRDNQDEKFRRNQSRNAIFPEILEEYRTQAQENIKGRVTKMFSQEFSRTENRILSNLYLTDELVLNPFSAVHSRYVLKTFQIFNGENQEMVENSSQNDNRPEVHIWVNHSSHFSKPQIKSYNNDNSYYFRRWF